MRANLEGSACYLPRTGWGVASMLSKTIDITAENENEAPFGDRAYLLVCTDYGEDRQAFLINEDAPLDLETLLGCVFSDVGIEICDGITADGQYYAAWVQQLPSPGWKP